MSKLKLAAFTENIPSIMKQLPGRRTYRKRAMQSCSKCGAKHSRKNQRYCAPCHAAFMREWRKTHPLTPEQKKKDNCRSYANTYKKRGKLHQIPCEKCGSPKSQMHHHDYSKPLDVEWLCRPCHLALHREENRARERAKLKTLAELERAA